MRFMTDVVVDGVQAMTPAPVFRAFAGSATVFRPVSGQECSGFLAAASQVKSVSGAELAGAARLLGLIALGEGLLAGHGYVAQRGQERPRGAGEPVQAPSWGRVCGPVLADEPVRIDGSDSTRSTDSSSKGDNGGKPMTPWDFRSSSPPG